MYLVNIYIDGKEADNPFVADDEDAITRFLYENNAGRGHVVSRGDETLRIDWTTDISQVLEVKAIKVEYYK